MKNIVLVGMKFESNLGDRLIYECMDYFLKDYIKKEGSNDMDVRFLDMSGKEEYVTSGCEEANTDNLKYQAKNLIRKLVPSKLLAKRQLDRKQRGRENLIQSLQELLKKKVDKNTKAIIFAGGGILKYKYQDFHICIDVITNYAQQNNIPVMLSAVGVEGYDASNEKCLFLKKAINRDCVKMITTRDDIELLKNNYLVNENIKAYLVADPACSTSHMKPMKATVNKKKVIGIGIARERIFIDNGIPITKEELFQTYSSLIQLIEKKGYDYFFFTTGTLQDQVFAEKVKEYLKIDVEIAKRPESIDDFITIINRCDVTIVCRLHASIVSYSYGIPTIAFVWNNKQRFFGKLIGHEERFIDINKDTIATLDTLIDQSINDTYNKTDEYIGSTKLRVCEFLKACI